MMASWIGPSASTDLSSTTTRSSTSRSGPKPQASFISLYTSGTGFCFWKLILRIANSWHKHASSADSSRPGPRSLWTSMAALMISCVISLSVMGRGFQHRGHREQREELRDGDFFVGAEDVAEGVADFAEGGVGFHGIVDKRHEIVFAFGGGAQGAEAAVDLGLGAIGAELFQAGGLAVRDRFVNLQNVQRLFLGYEIIYADDDLFLFVHSHLVTIGGFGDFPLRVAALDGRDHAAHGVDFLDVIPSATLDFIGESFDKVGAAERIDSVCDAGFVGDDLLGAQGNGGGELRRQRPGFIEGICVQRLRATEHRGEGLDRGADNVVVGLLRGQRAAGGLRMKAQRPGARVF